MKLTKKEKQIALKWSNMLRISDSYLEDKMFLEHNSIELELKCFEARNWYNGEKLEAVVSYIESL